MKKSIIILLIICIITTAFPLSAYCAQVNDFIPDDVKFAFLNGAKVGIYDDTPEILERPVYRENEKMMIPAKFIFLNLGYEIKEDENAFIATGENTVSLTVDKDEISVNNEKITLSSNVIKNVWFISEEIFSKLGYTYNVVNDLLIVSDSEKIVTVNENNIKPLFGVYISPYSNKAAGGTPDSPLGISSIEKRTEEIVKKYGELFPTFIFFMGGEYKIFKTLDFSSSTFTSPSHKTLHFEAYGDSAPVLSGSVELDVNDLKPVTDAQTLARIPSYGRGKVAYMDLSEYNITFSNAAGYYHYVYLDGMKQQHSRWPNEGFANVKSVPQAGSFGFSETEPTTWTKAKEGRIMGYFQVDYILAGMNITSVDPVNKLINGPNFGLNRAGAKYYATNMLEVVDIPGEWYVDTAEEILYYYPPYTLKDSRLEIAATPSLNVFSLGNAKNITFKGIHFSKFGGYAIHTTYPENIEIRNCDFSDLQGLYAIQCDQTAFNVVIDSNTIYNCEGGLVRMKSGNTATGKNGNCVISNNHCIASQTFPKNGSYMIGGGYPSYERLGSIGIDIFNNVFQDCGNQSAIQPNGEDIKVYYNEVMNQSRNIDDGGAIYFGKAHTFQGCEVMYNYVHDLNKEHAYCAYYNDDCHAGIKWMYNISKDVNKHTITGLGPDFNMSFNLAINNATGFGLGSRMTWTPATYGDNGQLYNETVSLLNSGYAAEYLKKYPNVAEYIDRKPYAAPWNAIVYGNVGVNTGGKTIAAVPKDELVYFADEFSYDDKTVDISETNATAEVNPHFSYSDDYFVDPESQNFNLKPESELAKTYPELLNIDITKIGIEEDKVKDIMITPKDGFKLRHPMNGDGSVQTKATLFSWDQVRGASKYRVMVATDKEMKNLVYDNTVWENNADNHIIVDSLTLDTVYYWQVEAIGISRQNPFTVKSVGPLSFKTAKKNELSKEGLKLAIESATKFFEGLNSSEEYSYDETFLKDFRELLDKANNIYKTSSEQEEINQTEEDIYIMVNKSLYFQLVHYDHLDIFRPEQVWKHGREKAGIKYNDDGSVSLYTDGGTHAVTDVLTKNSILCFKVKFDDFTTDGYRAVYFKLNDGGRGYLIVVKPDVLEFQGINQTMFTLPNYSIKPGEWHEMQLGGINTPGGVLQFWKLDGKIIFAKLDTTGGQTRDEGHIRIQHCAPSTHFKKVDTLPSDQTLYEAVLKDFDNPLNEDQLEAMLIGCGDALEMNSTFYNISDKNEMARILYPKIESKEIQISENGDISAYKNALTEAMIISGYNTGLEDYIFKNRVKPYYQDILKLEKIDNNGINLYDFYKNKLKDIDRIDVHTSTMNKGFNSFEDLRKEFAKQILRVSINACERSFANENDYYTTILTKENADYIGINIDNYLALDTASKNTVNAIIHSTSETERTMEEIVEQIEAAIAGL